MDHEIFTKQKSQLQHLKSQDSAARIAKLKKLKKAILDSKIELFAALKSDLGKSESEAELTELATSLDELDFAIANLSHWMKPKRVGSPLKLLGTTSTIRFEPKGRVLIIGPWNFPFYLIIPPLVSAVAAGNAVILKPSELSPNTGRYLQSLIAKVFDECEVACILGDVTVSTELLKLPFDHIFYTGGPRVGKIVMQAAAQNLVPVTLELGGKSPVIIEESAHLPSAALRVVWGKLLNAGQVCVAPDYVFVPASKQEEFLIEAKKALSQILGATESEREKSDDYGRIVNSAHFERLKSALEKSTAEGSMVVTGGLFRAVDRYFAPTILSQVDLGNSIMKEEIFGPILPVLTYEKLETVYQYLNENEKPLTLYVFSNNTMTQITNPYLPFGGQGQSGLGSYHGYYGFKTFTHERAVLEQGPINFHQLIYPPYRNFKKRLIRWMTQFLNA